MTAAGLLALLWSLVRAPYKLPRPRRAVAVGDSLTAHGGYVARLRETVGGTWTSIAEEGAGLWRIVQLVRGRLAPYDAVVVLGGVNSIGRGYQDNQAGLIELYRAARVGSARVIAVTMTPWRGYRGWTQEHDDVRARLAQWQLGGASGFVDATVNSMAALGDANGHLWPAYDAGDGLHLNAAGQRALGDAIAGVFAAR